VETLVEAAEAPAAGVVAPLREGSILVSLDCNQGSAIPRRAISSSLLPSSREQRDAGPVSLRRAMAALPRVTEVLLRDTAAPRQVRVALHRAKVALRQVRAALPRARVDGDKKSVFFSEYPERTSWAGPAGGIARGG
jgi:hypothetical protein